MNAIHNLHSLGQSIWYDNIQRRLLENGALEKMIKEDEIRGVTSNPSIFQNAIAKSNDYDSALKPMAWAGWSAEQIFWQLAIEDIQAAADLFLPLYESSGRQDGYVSLEVNPLFANDAASTLKEAKALWNRVNRPNLMIKIPATKAGLPAVRAAISEGINVNVTLIFSLERYQEVIDAYLAGLEDRVAAEKSPAGIASVASFFVSRVDSKTDSYLQKKMEADASLKETAAALLGKAAIANARLAYKLFEKEFSSERFMKLQQKGAAVQRPLWASTSTKNPAYRDVVYVEELIGDRSVNTVPPQTLTAFAEHGKAALTIKKDLTEAEGIFGRLAALGISIATVTDELEIEGVKAFADAFKSLMQSIEEKRIAAVGELGPLKDGVKKRADQIDNQNILQQLFDNKPEAWTEEPAGKAEFQKRSGWLQSPWKSEEILGDLEKFVQECAQKGYHNALLLGMGGSSLAPEVLSIVKKTFTPSTKGMDVAILDSTDPGQVQAASEKFPFDSTLFIVASKSGTTSEIVAYLDFFWAKAIEKLGSSASDHFAAITDPGTALDKLAAQRNFVKIFHGDPNVGGRFSALTGFGLVPAALAGLDVTKIVASAIKTAKQSSPERPLGSNPGGMLGVVLGEAWSQGKDKLTIISDPALNAFGSWMEQLIAESSGKCGKGIVPVDIEPEILPGKYSSDRLFTYLRVDGSRDDFVNDLKNAGKPVLTFDVKAVEEIGSCFYLWEVATAVACAVLKVNPFDQPDVQDNKSRTQKKIQAYLAGDSLPKENAALSINGVDFFGEMGKHSSGFGSVKQAIFAYLKEHLNDHGDYIAINAYLPRNEKNLDALQQLRREILTATGNATTLGFGPRFLHSTGQLHKGGENNGVFIQIVAEPEKDIDIPGEGLSFGVLERAQADGDMEALKARDRRVLRVLLPRPQVNLLLE